VAHRERGEREHGRANERARGARRRVGRVTPPRAEHEDEERDEREVIEARRDVHEAELDEPRGQAPRFLARRAEGEARRRRIEEEVASRDSSRIAAWLEAHGDLHVHRERGDLDVSAEALLVARDDHPLRLAVRALRARGRAFDRAALGPREPGTTRRGLAPRVLEAHRVSITAELAHVEGAELGRVCVRGRRDRHDERAHEEGQRPEARGGRARLARCIERLQGASSIS
jgi:hypothetical protein